MREIVARLPSEDIIYFGDTARVPYGPKSAETVLRYSRQAATFLLERGVKLLVIACNTATARAGEELAAELPIPVVGVVEPGARAAVDTTRTGRIGVIGTVGTISSGAYDLAVRRRLPDARVYAQPCPLFVPLVEEGWSTHPVARLVAAEYLAPLHEVDVDVLILGCTHYPALQPVLEQVMGENVTLVDSARETALDVEKVLTERGLLADAGEPAYTFVASDLPSRFREVGGRIFGELIGAVERVDMESGPPRS
jgi:glutamate racemase